jgi:lipoate-protein ligase B
MARPVQIEWLGRAAYDDALALQRRLVDERAGGCGVDRLLLLEHDPVVTLGRGFTGPEPELGGVPVVKIERGGKATYHGPGQLVGYPIVALGEGERDLHAYLRKIEDVLIGALAEFGLDGVREPGATGVWILTPAGLRKVASIGVAVRRWVTFHGFALNVAGDLRGFSGFEPCGFRPEVMTSLEAALGRPVPLEESAAAVRRAFVKVFDGQVISPEATTA